MFPCRLVAVRVSCLALLCLVLLPASYAQTLQRERGASPGRSGAASRQVVRPQVEDPEPSREGGVEEAATNGAGTSDRDFSFIHMSDTHVEPYLTTVPESLDDARSYLGVRSIADVEEIPMPPFQITAPRPEFALVTGDVTEFGFPGVTPEVVDAYFSDLGMPVYLSTGNHDNTQVASPEFWRERFGGQNYSFDSNGCHFIALNSASLQDPNPSFGEEVLTFLKNDLKKVRPSTPVFVYFHHPLHSGEFASPYDGDRILDALRRHNVALILVGHGHSTVTFDYAGIDAVMGGSTFVAKRQKPGADGYGVCYIKGDRLMYAYRSFERRGATKRLMDKPLARFSDYPAITVSSPAEASTVSGERLAVAVGVAGTSGTLSQAEWNLNDETSGTLTIDGEALYTVINTAGLDPGAHYLRITVRDETQRKFQRSVPFYFEPGTPVRATTTRSRDLSARETTSAVPLARWRYRMGAASKATPLVADGRVYVGANDGKFRALNQKTGRLEWEFDAGAEILTTALAHKDLVVFGAGDGKIYALKSATGRTAWTYDAGAPVFSSPVAGPEGEIFVGTNGAQLIALAAATGKELWRNAEAQYGIETAAAVDGDRVYFGAWDGLIYCADRKTGKTVWSKPNAHNLERVVRYHAAADAPLVVAGDRVFVSDRGYSLGAFRADNGDFQTTVSIDSAAVSLAGDGNAVYSRGTKTPLVKMSLDGTPIWESNFVPGRIPVPPYEVDGKIYIANNVGILHAVDAASGLTLWKYRITPRLYVMSGVAVTKDTIYTTGFDGVVTAIRMPDPGPQ